MKSLRRVSLAAAVLGAALGVVQPGTVHANGCTVGTAGSQVDRIITTCGADDKLEISDRVCLGTQGASIEDNTFDCDFVVFGVVKIGGDDRDVVVNGDIKVKDGGRLEVRRTVNGDVKGEGNAQIELARQAMIVGDVKHKGPAGFVDFKGEVPQNNPNAGATQVDGDVKAEGGALILATGINTKNLVTGDLKCQTVAGGTPTATDWDGDGTTDGTVVGNFKCPGN